LGVRASKTQKVMKKDIRVTFIGDSFVNGTGDESYLGWVGRVCAKTYSEYPDIELTCYNLGVRKETSGGILERFELEIKPRLRDTDSHIAILSFGVNDCAQNIDLEVSKQNLNMLLTQAKKSFQKLLFVMPPPIADQEINQKIKCLIDQYRFICKELEVEYIDFFDILSENKIWKKQTRENDGAHPKSQGYEIFAKLIFESDGWKQLWRQNKYLLLV
jgi:lysophospholipase L1-like esterase